MSSTTWWVLVAVAIYMLGVAVYSVYFWPASRARRALSRLSREGAPLRRLTPSEARWMQVFAVPADSPVYSLHGPYVLLTWGSMSGPQQLHTLAGVPVKFASGQEQALRAGDNNAEVVVGSRHAWVLRLNGTAV
ncbi:hypothetical protein ACQ5SB_17865 [Stenotrophomonas geniculata]|uniref:hypothetical protein n=1 Tax=Stenotrophomonas TaxID=40323 RepID=UPI000FA75ABC|nr:hypothetical protein [Stenotrophomonas maltophilia]MCO7463024.1 hypothetical protein [Stenotrophomonas maltophilia]